MNEDNFNDDEFIGGNPEDNLPENGENIDEPYEGDDDVEAAKPESDKEPSSEEAHSAISADLIRGHINTIILRALYERDKYGYEIMNDIEAKSHGQYTLKQPTLYSALKRLETQGYIKAYWKKDDVTSGGRRKYFTLTEIGKEMTEKNLAEWEYSRTIIDSLISDRAFDFSRPAPTPVDFTILRDSVSRVPHLNKDENEDKEPKEQSDNIPTIPADSYTTYNIQYAQPQVREATESAESRNLPAESAEKAGEGNRIGFADYPRIAAEDIPEPGTPVIIAPPDEQAASIRQAPAKTEEPAQSAVYAEPVRKTEPEEPPAPAAYSQPAQPQQPTAEQISVQNAEQAYRQQTSEYTRYKEQAQAEPAFENTQLSAAAEQARLAAEEEAKRRAHENYLKLISEPVRTNDDREKRERQQQEGGIYTNRPAPERDYKNLIDGIFVKALANGSVQTNFAAEQPAETPPPQQQRGYSSPIMDRANSDGIRVMPSTEYHGNAQSAATTVYNKGKTLLKCSLIVFLITLIEFAVCLIFGKTLGTDWLYASVILAIGLVQLAVFLILDLKGYGGHCAKPTSASYLSKCIIITIIAILIICVFAFLMNINFTVVGEIVRYMVMPSVTALNITVFAVAFYFFVR